VGGMVGTSTAILEVSEIMLRVAARRQPVLISGETGTGKELVARAIHSHGIYRNGPFVTLDCGATADSLIESELFGHLRGSFAGASDNRPGLLAAAASGTLFLDEVGELSLPSQAKLFRVLQDYEFRPVGDDVVHGFAGRIVAATNRDLTSMVKAGTFRQELYFRLNVHRLHIPPLRARTSDIPLLVRHFIVRHGEGNVLAIAPDALRKLMDYPWPGNVRELDNCILAMCANCDGRVLDVRHFPLDFRKSGFMDRALTPGAQSAGSPLKDAEREALAAVLESTGGNVAEAARRLGISRATVYRKVARHTPAS
jgi:DNA-binding NtrC family response regulator